MNIYTIYIHDDRYSVPSLDIIEARNESDATSAARRRLAESPFHRAIEIWTIERFLTRIEAGDEA